MANTNVKNLGISIAALLASYAVQKVADKNTSFIETRTAITAVALQTAQALISERLAKATANPAVATTTDATIAQ